jgi:hypothetical protein
MARCTTLYQCLNFLARNEGTISLAPHPTNPRKNRMTIRIGEEIAAIEYSCDQEMDLLAKILTPVCRTLQEHIEKEV